MMRPLFRALAFALAVTAAPAVAVERVEVVLDASSGMWQQLDGGLPLFVAVRDALQDYAAAAALRQGRPEVAIRIVGGNNSLGSDGWCTDTRLVAAFGVINSQACREALENLQPGGGRPLVRGLNEAVEDLEDAGDRRRIVLITSGADQCHQDIIATVTSILAADPPIEVRIIGLGLDPTLANAATTLAPTRNLTDTGGLAEALKWALQPADTRPTVASQIEMSLFHGGRPIPSAAIELTDATGSERAFSTVENGHAGVQLAPGRYRATIEMDGRPTIDLAGITVGPPGQTLEIHLSDAPPVTLEIVPEWPTAGGLVDVGFWGAPAGITWVAVALPGTSVASYITRTRAAAGSGGATFQLPETPAELEARFIYEPQPGIFQLLGTRRLETGAPSVEIAGPEEVENGKLLTISWTGPGHPGDHISITPRGADPTDHVVCLAVSDPNGTFQTTAPPTTGNYVISYNSAHGRVLDRRDLEVFEVLATLDGPASAPAASLLSIVWTGPDDSHDFLSLARAGSADADYIDWAPTADGNPAQLRAPLETGLFELRYVRSSDAAVLARHPLEIVESAVELQVQKTVVAGTRFEVEWTGTARSRDFLAVAELGADARDHLDFSFASEGSPSTLAAPFEPGNYEVRFVAGSSFEIVAAVPLVVR